MNGVRSRGQMQLTPVGHRRLHFPDCAVRGVPDDGSILGIELERTAKGRARLRRILSAYVDARHIARVRYCVTDRRVRALVQTETARLCGKPGGDRRPVRRERGEPLVCRLDVRRPFARSPCGVGRVAARETHAIDPVHDQLRAARVRGRDFLDEQLFFLHVSLDALLGQK